MKRTARNRSGEREKEMAGRNSVSGGNHHGRGPRTRRRARLGGLGFAKRETEGTRELGGRRGSRPCCLGGRKWGLARWPPWPATMARGACGQSSGSQQKRENSYREIEGRTAKLTTGKDGVDGGSGKTATRTADGGPWSFSVRQLRPGTRRKWSGERERAAREGLGFA